VRNIRWEAEREREEITGLWAEVNANESAALTNVRQVF
jgi:hypothetical protein